MRQSSKIDQRIFTLQLLESQIKWWRLINKSIAFTNGVFDILHEGHIKVLSQAASFADILIVGVNSDASVKRLKGKSLANNQQSRALLLASLIMVDGVSIFDEDTPLGLIKKILPDVLIKGGDYTQDTIVGAREVIANGGKIEIIPLLEGFSSTGIIEKINQV